MFKSLLYLSGVFCVNLGFIAAVDAGDRSEYEKWMKQQTQSYQEYRDKRDKEFSGFLKKHWKEMHTFQGIVRDKAPKPVSMPVAPVFKPKVKPQPLVVIKPKPDKKPLKIVEKKPPVISAPVIPVIKVPVIKPAPKPVIVKPVPTVQLPKGKTLKVEFYGQKLNFTYDPKLNTRLASKINGKTISSYWSSLSKASYEPLLKQISSQRAPLNLNDWGYALLVNEIARGISPNRKNEQAMFTWFVLIKAGYQARIAYDANKVYLLLPSKQPLYAAPYFTFDKVRYYALGLDGKKQKLGRVFTYDGEYPGATKRINMKLDSAINTARKEHVKFLTFKFKGKKYRIRVGYDQYTVNFLKTYPQMDIGMYFSSKVNQTTANPLLKQLKPLVEGKSEQEAVNLLLRFVQTSLQYKTDEGQFGTENYLFPEETLHYPYSDCEDRSVFFAWLVHNLLNLDVVGLDYPGHISAAVKFNEKINGDSIRFNGESYVITDPTYINANAGMTMPEFKNKKPGVIRINTF
jgi:hypothetical protein